MTLGKLPVPGRPITWMIVGQGPTALAVGRVGLLGHFYSHLSSSPLSPFLWETARDRLKYCLKGPLNPKLPTNQPMFFSETKPPEPSIANGNVEKLAKQTVIAAYDVLQPHGSPVVDSLRKRS